MAENTIGKVYIQVEPTTKGMQGKLSSELNAEGKKSGGSFASGFASVAGTVGKVAVSAVAAGATAIGAMAKGAVDSFAEFEQLKGGAELMFGEAYDFIADKAANAFASVQMSQNEYLQQANGFATGLKTAMGGDALGAAKLADSIITAEADIVAATGNTAENVQNAFNGIMKSNYTMLDNLQLGITPTKQGFQELIDQVNKWNAEQGNATNYQIDNLADAEQALVDYVAMVGVSGYASNEASETIQGSLASMTAAWSNLLTGLASGEGDIDKLIENLVKTVGDFAKNIIPVVRKSIAGIGNLISEIVPVINAELPGFIQEVLPSLLLAGTILIQGLVDGLLTALPTLVPVVTEIALKMVNLFLDNLPLIVQVGFEAITQLALGIAQALPTLIPKIVETVLTIVEYLVDNIDLLIDAAFQLMTGLADGLITALPILIEKIPDILYKFVVGFVQHAPEMLGASVALVGKLLETFLTEWPKFIAIIPKLIIMLVAKLVSLAPQMKEFASKAVETIKTSLSNRWTELTSSAVNLFNRLKEAFSQGIPGFVSIGRDIVNGIRNGITDAWDSLTSWFSDKIQSIKDIAAHALEIGSPSKVFAREIGRWIPAGIAVGIENGMGVLNSAIEEMSTSTLKNTVADMAIGTSYVGNGGVYSGTVAGVNGGYNQTVNIYSPTPLNASEIARQTRNSTRGMVLALRGV